MAARSRKPIRCSAGLALLVALACACGGTRSAPAPAGDAAPVARAPAPGPDAAPAADPTVALRLDRAELNTQWDARAGKPGDDAVRGWLDAELAAAALFAEAPASAPARLELVSQLGFAGAPGKETRIDVAVAVRLRWKEGAVGRTIEARVLGQQDVRAGDRKKLPQVAEQVARRAMKDAVAQLAARDRIRRGDPATVIAALDHADPDVRGEAYRAVADRKLAAAVPRLIELLASTDPDIRDAAIGALVELRDPRAVKPLVDMVEFNDLDMMRRIIDAVGAIGGEEARAYLDFVATGHDVPAVRELAKEALDRLERREQRAAAPP